MEYINLREMLVAINTRLEQLLDHDHCLKHALLIHVKTIANQEKPTGAASPDIPNNQLIHSTYLCMKH